MPNVVTRILNFFSGAKRSITGATSHFFPNWFGVSSSAGEAVNDDSALAVNGVYACCKVLSETIASLPVRMYKRDQSGNVQIAGTRPEDQIFAYQPNELFTPYILKSVLQLHISLRGNAYAIIERDEFGYAKALHLQEPQNVSPEIIKGKLYYFITTGQGVKAYTPDEVLHLKGLTKNGILGLSPIALAREEIGISISARKFLGNTMRKGSSVKGVLETEGQLRQDQVNDIRANWSMIMSGQENAGNIPVLHSGLKFKGISLSPADAQFIQIAKLTLADIARMYRVPMHMVNELDRATFSNIEQQSLEFVNHCIRPQVKMWEDELNLKLVPKAKRGSHFFRFNLDALLRGDSKARAEFYTRLFSIGVFSQNEMRELEGLNPIENGDKYYVPLNMQDVNLPFEDPNSNNNNDNNVQEQPAPAR